MCIEFKITNIVSEIHMHLGFAVSMVLFKNHAFVFGSLSCCHAKSGVKQEEKNQTRKASSLRKAKGLAGPNIMKHESKLKSVEFFSFFFFHM